jgi:hypothetical protein
MATTQYTTTLHYGGSAGKRGRLSAKPDPKRAYAFQKKLETMVRLEAAGIGAAASAAMLCISVQRLNFLKNTPDYLTVRMRITHGIILDHDASLTHIREQRKEILVEMLPPALMILARELQRQPVTLAERAHQVRVAQDVLDRQGDFAKISKTEIKPVDSWDYEKHDAASKDIIAAIRGVSAAPPPPNGTTNSATKQLANSFTDEGMHSLEAVEANEAFSNSHTLSQTDQEAALARLEAEAAALELPIKGLVQ